MFLTIFVTRNTRYCRGRYLGIHATTAYDNVHKQYLGNYLECKVAQQQRCESAVAPGRRANRMKSNSSTRRHTPSVPTLVTHPASPRNPQLSPLQVRFALFVALLSWSLYRFVHAIRFHVYCIFTFCMNRMLSPTVLVCHNNIYVYIRFICLKDPNNYE